MRKHLPMTGNPALPVQTGICVAVSSIFGQFADRRQAIAAANAIVAQPLDPSYHCSSQTTS